MRNKYRNIFIEIIPFEKIFVQVAKKGRRNYCFFKPNFSAFCSTKS